MFESYYELKANPFRLSTDEQFRFAHKNYLKAWSYLRYALDQGEGFVMITGHPGSGKTTLIRDILSELDESKVLAINLVTNQLQAEELLRKVALEYGLPAETYNKATLLTRIEKFVTSQYEAGRRAIIVIDEAQNLTLNGLEELRLLSNLQTGSHPLFQVFLVGQDELRSLVLGPAMEQIRQRLIATCQIESMNLQQTEGYIEHRLGIVGWRDDPKLDPAIFPLIHYLTEGIPRKINHVASRLLLYGALEEKHLFTEEDVWIVAEELFDEERLAFSSGETFEIFKSKFDGVRDQLTESLNKEGPESVAQPSQSDPEDVAASEAETGSEPEPDLQQQSPGEEEASDQAANITEEKIAYGDSELAANSEPADFSVEDVTERVTTPYGKTFLDHDDQAERTSRVLDENRQVADELMAGAAANSSENESDSTLSSEVTSVNWPGGQKNSEQHPQHNTDEILNLPSMQAERRKHDIDQKGGLINTASTVDVDEVFSGSLGKSLRHIFVLVVVGFVILALFVVEPEQLQTAWLKVMSQIGTAPNQQAVDQPSAEKIDEKPGSNQVNQDTSDLPDGQEGRVESKTTAMADKPVKTANSAVDPNQSKGVAKLNSATGGSRQTLVEQKTPAVVVEQTSLDQYEHQATAAEDPIEKASKDYIATQSVYQKVEIDQLTQNESEDLDIEKKFQIYFEFDNTEIPEQFGNMLNDLFIVLSLNKKSTLRISGYTDASGEPLYNMRLSIERAQAVSKYFTDRGIPIERIQVEGRGPIPKLTDAEHEELEKRLGNRRVEIVLQENTE